MKYFTSQKNSANTLLLRTAEFFDSFATIILTINCCHLTLKLLLKKKQKCKISVLTLDLFSYMYYNINCVSMQTVLLCHNVV